MKKTRLSSEQGEALLKFVNNPLGLQDGRVKDVLDQALRNHLIGRRRKLEVIEETGLEDEINESLEEIARVHHSVISVAFPERLDKGKVPKDVFDTIAQGTDVSSDLLDDLQQHFVDGRKIDLYNDTKRAMMAFSYTFKAMNEFRGLLLEDENFKDTVKVPVIEQDTEQVMFL